MSETVLIIEDESPLRENLINLLQHEGFKAVAAADGLEGLAQARHLQPQLILCDISMPQLDGYGVLRELRQDPQIAMIPFIFLTGKGETEDFRQGMNLGADDYLFKPLLKQELLKAVYSRLQRHQGLLQSPVAADTVPPPVAASSLSPAELAGVAPVSTGAPGPGCISINRDSLTHLPNRLYLQQVLPEMLAKAQQYDQIVVLLSLDICRFSSINTAFGYGVGDTLLQNFANRLQDLIGPQGIVVRTSGDEFAIVLDGLFWEEDAWDWADRVARCCAEPFSLNGRDIALQVVMGGACPHPPYCDPDVLLLQADLARRSCKQSETKIPYVFHDSNLAQQVLEQGVLETDLNRAIAEGEFQVYYQPQITLPVGSVANSSAVSPIMDGQITGMEALIRWRHPYRGMIAPDRFINTAEQLGLIIPIGEWVLRTACLQAQKWQALSPVPLKISVNLSMRQLQQENLAEQVTRILQLTELRPAQLTLELTETNLMADMDSAIQTLTSLRRLGIKIAIDDFGKGYSSLHYLSSLPIDILKIDQSFVQQVNCDRHAATIATAIMTMAHELQLATVAEGVETPDQVTFLQAHGCHIMQGHLYSPALPRREFEALLQRSA
jgi:diguanylate cyclase